MSDLTSLISRLEAAEGPSRELDGMIFRAINPDVPDEDWRDFQDDVWCMRDPEDAIAFIVPPKFTESMDAAMTLMPAGVNLLDLTLSYDTLEPPCYPAISIRWYPPNKQGADWHGQVSSAPTIPLTMCLAAIELRASSLKARAKLSEARHD